MGRNEETRQTATFDLMGKPARMYRVTQGQGAVLAASKARGGEFMISRLWAVLESLFVDPMDWHRLDSAIVSGKLDLPDVVKFLEKVVQHDWDAESLLGQHSPFRADQPAEDGE